MQRLIKVVVGSPVIAVVLRVDGFGCVGSEGFCAVLRLRVNWAPCGVGLARELHHSANQRCSPIAGCPPPFQLDLDFFVPAKDYLWLRPHIRGFPILTSFSNWGNLHCV
jgi:hypothetical protein